MNRPVLHLPRMKFRNPPLGVRSMRNIAIHCVLVCERCRKHSAALSTLGRPVKRKLIDMAITDGWTFNQGVPLCSALCARLYRSDLEFKQEWNARHEEREPD